MLNVSLLTALVMLSGVEVGPVGLIVWSFVHVVNIM